MKKREGGSEGGTDTAAVSPSSPALAIERDVLKDLRAKLANSGGSGFHLRVTKKIANGYSFMGQLDGTTEDIESTLLRDDERKGWGPGRYRLWAHFHDGRRIPDVPAMEYSVGNPDDPAAARTAAIGAASTKGKRLSDIEEEVEVLKKEKERVRIEKELDKLKKEEDGMPPGILEKLAQMEMEVDVLRREKVEAEERYEYKSREDKLLARIDDLAAKINERSKVDPETEALKARIAQMEHERRTQEVDRHNGEMVAMRASFQAQVDALKASLIDSKKNTILDYTPMIAAVSPLVSAYLNGSKTAQEQVADALKTLGSNVKDANKMDLPKMIEMLTPIVMPLLSQKNDMSGMFTMIGNLVGPLVEAAAQAASNPPQPEDLGGMIQKALGMISKGLEDGKVIATKQAEAATAGASAMMRLGPPRVPPAPPAGKVPPAPPPPPKPRRPKSAVKEPPRSLPIVRFANRIAKAIETQDEEFEFYIAHAERDLTDEDLRQLARYNDGANLASYFDSLPGVNTLPFSKPYARRWLSKFIVALKTPVGEEPAVEPAPEAAEEAPVAAEVVERAPSPAPAPGKTRNDFDYPSDSKIERVQVEDMELPIEYPTPETVAKREEERKREVEKWSAFQATIAPPQPQPQPAGA